MLPAIVVYIPEHERGGWGSDSVAQGIALEGCDITLQPKKGAGFTSYVVQTIGEGCLYLGRSAALWSAFINALLKLLSYKDPVAVVAKRYKPIQYAVLGTTLGPLQIEAFLGGGVVQQCTLDVHSRLRKGKVRGIFM